MKPEQRQTLQREIMGATRDRMLREIAVMLETVAAGTPLLFLLEDLHWVDASTLDAISALARRRGRARLMLVATSRDPEPSPVPHPCEELKKNLGAHRLCTEIALGPLTEEDVESYIRGRQAESPNDLAKLAYRRSEGNSLFLVAVLDHMVERGYIQRAAGGWRMLGSPGEMGFGILETLRKAIEPQLGRLEEHERRALETASVAGVRFPAAVVAGACGMGEDAFDLLIGKLSRMRRLIRAVDSRHYEFVHSLYREALYERVAPSRRAKLHLRVGLELEASGGGEAATELAIHFEEGGEWNKAIGYLRMAAENMARRLAFREAAPLLEHALALVERLPVADRITPQLEMLERLGDFYRALYDPASLETLQKLRERARFYGEDAIEIRALLHLIPILARTPAGEEEAAAASDRALQLNALQPDPVVRAENRLETLFWRMLSIGWDRDQAAACNEALQEILGSGNRLAALSHSHEHGFLLWASARYREALQLALD